MDPTTPPLPQVSPQGGPPGGSPQMGMPSPLGGVPTMAASLVGGAQAAGMADARAQQPWVPPAYVPNAPSMVASPANGVAGDGTPFANAMGGMGADVGFQQRIEALQQNQPNVMDAVHNYLFNPVGSPEAKAYSDRVSAAKGISDAASNGYLAANPQVLAHLESDPVGGGNMLAQAFATAKAQRGAQGATPPSGVTMAPLDGSAKHDPNPILTAAMAQHHGTTPDAVHAFTHTTQYSLNDFLKATNGMTNGQITRMWAMQHYLSPAQQATATLLAAAQQQATAPNATNKARDEYKRTLEGASYNNPWLGQQ
jgi:hypothetical protein